jgi:EAL domain-containing protein (putative c-di-GMP-specific phosphodiesterase class I)/CheY-like chemotaxis protein
MTAPCALVLDDDAASGLLIARIARAAGFDCVATTAAAAFAERYAERVPAAIVLDLDLGETDGVQQLRYLKDKGYANALVLVSGFDARVLATSAALARGFGLYVADALTKPIRAASLKAVLERVLSERAPVTAERVLAAARDGELSLDYQPIVRGRTGPVAHVEALIRWNHPFRGRMLPGQFLPCVEDVPSAMHRITDWVIDAAIADYRLLRGAGAAVPIAVNLSGRDLDRIDLPDSLHARLACAGVPGDALCLEVTESAAAACPTAAMDVLTRFRLKGVRLALDDFGVGYSSLTMLRQLPFSALKIDISFVRDLPHSKDSVAIVKAILAIAAAMEMETVAEGVENDQQAGLLETLGAGALQGFLIARPMPRESLVAWLGSRAAA